MTRPDPNRASLSLLSGADPPTAADIASDVLGAAIDSLPVGVVVVGRDGVIARVNHEVERLFGYAGAELIGRSIDVLVPDIPRSSDGEGGLESSEPGAPPSVSGERALFGRRKDGSEIPVEIAWKPIQ